MATDSDVAPTPTSTMLPALTLNLGPLTTTFVPPDDCTSMTLGVYAHRAMSGNVTTLMQFNRGWGCPESYGRSVLTVITSCFPERYAPAYNNIQDWQGPNAVWPLYSPGLLCPSGYATGCTMVYSQPGASESLPSSPFHVTSVSASTLSTWSLLSQGQTGYGCCPIGYRCFAPYTCIFTPPLSATVTADMYQGCPTTKTNRTTSTQVISSDIWPFVYAPQVVLIQGANNSNDSNANATSTPGPSDPAASSASRDGDAHDGLSTATKAAIGTALPLILIILALAGYIFYRRRNRSKDKPEAALEQEETGLPGLNKPELDATPSAFGLSLGGPGSELDGTPGAHAASAGDRPSELPGSAAARLVGAICELPGDEGFARSPAHTRGLDGIAAGVDKEAEIRQGAPVEGASEPGKDTEKSGVARKDQ